MDWHPKSAMVLGAGLGTRMRPFSETTPKPLIALGGKALIDHVLDRLADAAVENVVVNLHYLAEKIESHLAGRQRPRVLISHERAEPLDTGGGVAKALGWFGKDPFLVHNSDSVWIEDQGSNLERLAARWDDGAMDALLMLAPVRSSLGYAGAGDFAMAASGALARRPEGGSAPYVFAGVSIAHPRLFDGAPQGPFSLNVVWDRAIRSGRLYGAVSEGIWMHVGDPAALELAERQLARGRQG